MVLEKCVFISYAFSNEKNPETNQVDKAFLQEYIARIADLLQEKWVAVWHSLIPHEDQIISWLPYDDAIQYCMNTMTELQKTQAVTLISILKYPAKHTVQDGKNPTPSTWMQREYTHAQRLGIKKIVAVQKWLQENELFNDYLDNSDYTFSFTQIENLYDEIRKLSL